MRQRARRRWTYALAAGIALVAFTAGVMRQFDRSDPPMLAGTLSIAIGPVFTGAATAEDWNWLSGTGPAHEWHALAHRCFGPRGVAAGLGYRAAHRGPQSTDPRQEARIELLEGRVYLDTHGVTQGVEIVTRFGTLRDIGTQFEVVATDTSLRVRTREGAVTLTRGQSDAVLRCEVSEELRIDVSGQVERGRIAAFDPEWTWVESLAEAPPGPELTCAGFSTGWRARPAAGCVMTRPKPRHA